MMRSRALEEWRKLRADPEMNIITSAEIRKYVRNVDGNRDGGGG